MPHQPREPEPDWPALRALRSHFLEPGPSASSYWTSPELLQDYDHTFGRRIRWKWEAVLSELMQSGWRPPAGRIVDWGCGTGIASRALYGVIGRRPDREWLLYDRSEAACRMAREALRNEAGRLKIRALGEDALLDACRDSVLLVSHVWGELDAEGRARLLACLRRARCVIWVEPGTREAAAALVSHREQLRERFHVVAPCTHQGPCGLRHPDRERDWCHHFCAPPPEVFTTRLWSRFHQETGIDLHRVPYAFLVLDKPRSGLSNLGDWTRTLGRPRIYKGHAKLLLCDDAGLREESFLKRYDPLFFRSLREAAPPRLVRWTREDGRLTGGERIDTRDV